MASSCTSKRIWGRPEQQSLACMNTESVPCVPRGYRGSPASKVVSALYRRVSSLIGLGVWGEAMKWQPGRWVKKILNSNIRGDAEKDKSFRKSMEILASHLALKSERIRSRRRSRSNEEWIRRCQRRDASSGGGKRDVLIPEPFGDERGRNYVGW